MCNSIEQHPGKFEGESCISKWAYALIMNGLGDFPEEDFGEDDNTQVITGPFTLRDVLSDNFDVEFCSECQHDLLQASAIFSWEDNSGFVHCDIRND